jgi:hypothetical protein
MNVPFVYRNRKTGLKPRERPEGGDDPSHSHFTARLRGQPSFRDSLAASARVTALGGSSMTDIASEGAGTGVSESAMVSDTVI